MAVPMNKTTPPSGARLRAIQLAPAAIKNGWSIARLAAEAKVSPSLAKSVLHQHASMVQRKVNRSIDRRLEVAQNAQNAALDRLPELQKLLDRAKNILVASLPAEDGAPGVPTALDDFGQPIPVDPERIGKAVHGLIKAGKDLHSYMEQATGMDVVKAVAVRSQTQQSGPVTSWEGMAALESAIEAETLPMDNPAEVLDYSGEEEAAIETDDWI